MEGWVHVLRLSREEMLPASSVMLWAMFCWETLGSAIHVDITLTCATYLNIEADQVHPFVEMVFLDVSGPFQQNNAPCKNGSRMV